MRMGNWLDKSLWNEGKEDDYDICLTYLPTYLPTFLRTNLQAFQKAAKQIMWSPFFTVSLFSQQQLQQHITANVCMYVCMYACFTRTPNDDDDTGKVKSNQIEQNGRNGWQSLLLPSKHQTKKSQTLKQKSLRERQRTSKAID
jgi:hypothetical protein